MLLGGGHCTTLFAAVLTPDFTVINRLAAAQQSRRRLAVEWAGFPSWSTCEAMAEDEVETRSCMAPGVISEEGSMGGPQLAAYGVIGATVLSEVIGHTVVLAMGAGPTGLVGSGEWMTALSEGTGVGGANPMDVLSYSQSSVWVGDQVASCGMPDEYRQFAAP